LLLRSVAAPALSRFDACLFAAPARSSMLSLIQATIVAQDSPQCVRTCRVRLPAPELQCPGALLQFQLPNALLLPAGEPRIEITAAEFNNGGAGFQVSWEGGAGVVLSLDAASCNVKVMQVPPHLLLPRISHCNSRHRIAGADELHLCNHGLSHPHHLCPLLCPRLLALLPRQVCNHSHPPHACCRWPRLKTTISTTCARSSPVCPQMICCPKLDRAHLPFSCNCQSKSLRVSCMECPFDLTALQLCATSTFQRLSTKFL